MNHPVRQFASDNVITRDIRHLDDVNHLIELFPDLLNHGIVAINHDSHTREVRDLTGANGNTFDVETTPSKKAGHPVKHSGLVLHQSN